MLLFKKITKSVRKSSFFQTVPLPLPKNLQERHQTTASVTLDDFSNSSDPMQTKHPKGIDFLESAIQYILMADIGGKKLCRNATFLAAQFGRDIVNVERAKSETSVLTSIALHFDVLTISNDIDSRGVRRIIF